MADTYLKYIEALKNLLPNGKVWRKKDEDGSSIRKLLSACAVEFGRIHDRIIQLGEECDPRTASETLEDWERVLDLPDRCIEDPDSLTVEQRRSAIVQKIVGRGGQSLSYFEQMAAFFGYDITCSNYTPFTAGSDAGDALTNDDWRFWFNVNAASVATYFTAGNGAAGDPLVEFGEDVLECLINKLKPAHTKALFTYDV